MLAIVLTTLEGVSPPANLAIDRVVIDYLRPVLKHFGEAARVNYAGICSGKELVLPDVSAQPAPPGATGISAVRQIFRDDPRVTVTQDQSGMFKIRVGSVSTTALRTRLPSLTLDSNTQFTPPAAVDAIAIAADRYAKERKLGFGMAATIIDIIMSGPAKGAPHLAPLTENVTVDQALDSVTRTFKGVVLYGTCTQPDGKELFRADYIYGL